MERGKHELSHELWRKLWRETSQVFSLRSHDGREKKRRENFHGMRLFDYGSVVTTKAEQRLCENAIDS